MKRLILMLALVVSMSGCAIFGATDEALLREVRKDLVESTRPALVDALNHARGHNGMIDPLRTEKVNTVDAIIDSVDRVYPPEDEDGNPNPYRPSPIPWENGRGGD